VRHRHLCSDCHHQERTPTRRLSLHLSTDSLRLHLRKNTDFIAFSIGREGRTYRKSDFAGTICNSLLHRVAAQLRPVSSGKVSGIVFRLPVNCERTDIEKRDARQADHRYYLQTCDDLLPCPGRCCSSGLGFSILCAYASEYPRSGIDLAADHSVLFLLLQKTDPRHPCPGDDVFHQ
jgi:hypothetical protein